MAHEATGSAKPRLSISGIRLAKFVGWFKKTHPDTGNTDLLRLAEASPHLLRDLGFSRDVDGTWTNGSYRVSTPVSTPSDRLRVWWMRV